MAYPDYSIVIVDVTNNGVTAPLSMSFYDNAVAKKVYNDAVASNKRAFIFEKPKATDFARNDALPLVDARASEAAMLVAAPITDWTGNPQVDRVLNAELEVINAYYDLVKATGEKVADGYVAIGSRLRTTYQKANGFIYHLFDNIQFEAAGSVKFSVSIDHKTYKVETTGSIALSTSITNDCAEYGTYVHTTDGHTVYVNLHEAEYLLGTFIINFYADGECGEYEEREYTYVPEGTMLGSWNAPNGNNETYYSNGTGWYYIQYMNGEPTQCPDAGIENNPLNRTEGEGIRYFLGEREFITGNAYQKWVTDGNCGEEQITVREYLPAGTELLREVSNNGYVTTVYTSNGNGGVDVNVDDQTPPPPPTNPDPHENYAGYCADNPNDPICQCPAEGATSDWLGVPFPATVEAYDLEFGINLTQENAGTKHFPSIANGQCGFNKDETGMTIEWNVSEGDTLDGSYDPSEDCSTGGTIFNFAPNGQVQSIYIAPVRLASVGQYPSKVNVNPNPNQYPNINSWYVGTQQLQTNRSGGKGTPLTAAEKEIYQKGDYRVDINGAYVYAYWSYRLNVGVAKTNQSFTGFWTTFDAQRVQSIENEALKALFPADCPFSGGTSKQFPNVRVGRDKLGNEYITGIIYYGRQVAWNKLYDATSVGEPDGLRWYQEEDLINRGELQYDARWRLPYVSDITKFWSRNSNLFGGANSGKGGSTIESYLPPQPIKNPEFTKEFWPMIEFSVNTHVEAPNKRVGWYANGTLTDKGNAKWQLYNGHEITIKCDGKGGLDLTINPAVLEP